MAMEWGFIGVISWLIPTSFLAEGANQSAKEILESCVWWAAVIIPWVTYIAHFICTLCVRERRSFLVLIWILIGIVVLNLGSCAYFFHAPPE